MDCCFIYSQRGIHAFRAHCRWLNERKFFRLAKFGQKLGAVNMKLFFISFLFTFSLSRSWFLEFFSFPHPRFFRCIISYPRAWDEDKVLVTPSTVGLLDVTVTYLMWGRSPDCLLACRFSLPTCSAIPDSAEFGHRQPPHPLPLFLWGLEVLVLRYAGKSWGGEGIDGPRLSYYWCQWEYALGTPYPISLTIYLHAWAHLLGHVPFSSQTRNTRRQGSERYDTSTIVLVSSKRCPNKEGKQG